MDQYLRQVCCRENPHRPGCFMIPIEQARKDRVKDCLQCGKPMVVTEGRKDAICNRCGYKWACCEA